MRAEFAGASHVGWRRTTNEDSWSVERSPSGLVLAIVADGLGGHSDGEVASLMAVQSMQRWFYSLRDLPLREAIERAHVDILYAASERSSNMGSTLTNVLIDPERASAQIAYVGDCRVYRLREGKLDLLTKDDTLVQALYEEGRVSAEEMRRHPMRHHLTQALGASAPLDPHCFEVDLQGGDRLLLCSDGLNNELGDDDITFILATADSAEDGANSLVEATLMTQARDNVTAVVLFIR